MQLSVLGVFPVIMLRLAPQHVPSAKLGDSVRLVQLAPAANATTERSPPSQEDQFVLVARPEPSAKLKEAAAVQIALQDALLRLRVARCVKSVQQAAALVLLPLRHVPYAQLVRTRVGWVHLFV